MEPITLATLPNATAQQVFDYVVAHLRKQGRKSALPTFREDKPGPCRYRMTAQDGTVLRCAAGCLIADSEYLKEREGSSWAYLSGVYDADEMVVVSPKERRVPSQHALLIKGLQHVHDNIIIDLWEDKFKQVAEANSLEYTAPETK